MTEQQWGCQHTHLRKEEQRAIADNQNVCICIIVGFDITKIFRKKQKPELCLALIPRELGLLWGTRPTLNRRPKPNQVRSGLLKVNCLKSAEPRDGIALSQHWKVSNESIKGWSRGCFGNCLLYHT